MKKLLVLALASLALTGCGSRGMSNDMIIVESAKCEQAGLPWRQTYDDGGRVTSVQCVPHYLRPAVNGAGGPDPWRDPSIPKPRSRYPNDVY